MSENINEVVNDEVNEVEAAEPAAVTEESVEVTEEAVEVAEAAIDTEEAIEAEEEPAVASVLDRDEADLALVRKKEIYDKITTGLLILLMCAPFAILAYIIIWFLNP